MLLVLAGSSSSLPTLIAIRFLSLKVLREKPVQMLHSDRSVTRTSDSAAKAALLQIVCIRFRAFEAKFGRLPKPDEPIFFDETQSHPVKASISEAGAQLEQGARAARVNVEPVLSFLGLSPRKLRSFRRTDEGTRRVFAYIARSHQSNRRESGFSAGWNRFLANERLRRRHRITREELRALSSTAFLGEPKTERQFLFILETIRRAPGED